MVDKKGDQPPVQHTPKHLEGDSEVFDSRHPAASAFAPVQPGAGVVSDDADEKGQNLAGGEKASDAEKTYSDQKEVLAEQHNESLQAAVVAPAASNVGDDGSATPAKKTVAPEKK